MKPLIFLILLGVLRGSLCLDITFGIGTAVIAGIGYLAKDRLFCSFNECCTPEYLINDVYRLDRDLKTHLHGQKLIIEKLIPALQAHLFGQPKKSLVISMHGWTGGGKTYTTRLLVDALFAENIKSKFVHRFFGRLHFPLESRVEQYKLELQKRVKESVKLCPQSIFVFDEIDKMPAGVIDAIKPFMDYHQQIDGVDYRRTIFVFISNVGGGVITSRYLQLWEQGLSREKMEYKHFEPALRRALYTEEGPLQDSTAIESHLVSLYLPFLPLEREQLRDCVRDEMKRIGVPGVSNAGVESILEELEYYQNRFSTSGCKRIVDLAPSLKLRVLQLD